MGISLLRECYSEGACTSVSYVLLCEGKHAIPDSLLAIKTDCCPIDSHQLANSFERQSNRPSWPSRLELTRQGDEPHEVRFIRLSFDCLPRGIKRIWPASGIAGHAHGDARNFYT